MSYFLILILSLHFGPASACVRYAQRVEPQASAEGGAFQRGLTALKENRLEDALAEFTTAEREQPENARVRNFRGILLVQTGKNAEAAAEYLEAIRLDPIMEDAYRNLGFLRWTERQLGPAYDALRHAVELSPDDSFAHYYLGRVELDAQQYEQAFHELEISRQPLPAEPGFLIQAATGYVGLGRQEDARKALEQLMKMQLTDAQSVGVASLLLSIHENASAIKMLQTLNKGHGATPASWTQFDLALAYLLSGKYVQAIEEALAYTKSMKTAGSESVELARAWCLMGIANAHLNRGEESVSALHRAASFAPHEEEHWLNLTRELMELSRFPEAVTEAQNGLAVNRNSYALHLRLGAAYLAAGRYAESESVFRNLVAAGDPLPLGYVGLAQVLLRTGRAADAATELADAEKKLGPKFLLSYFRGLALARAAKPAEALAAFQQAVQLDPKNAEAHVNLGKTQLTLGQVNEAISELRESLRHDPDNTQAKRLLSQAYRRAGDAQNAARYADSSAEPPAAPTNDLIGDFFVPELQFPPNGREEKVP
ncbi:MAG TPA: tetratricopeptide repeat protein [Candidatus Acidoferrum sp.]|jgi:tetratricopeptide (TPR) repeat protein|nr:tetratricopeptide repeat protein [Candidatus Acidoferrum sp.]